MEKVEERQMENVKETSGKSEKRQMEFLRSQRDLGGEGGELLLGHTLDLRL